MRLFDLKKNGLDSVKFKCLNGDRAEKACNSKTSVNFFIVIVTQTFYIEICVKSKLSCQKQKAAPKEENQSKL